MVRLRSNRVYNEREDLLPTMDADFDVAISDIVYVRDIEFVNGQVRYKAVTVPKWYIHEQMRPFQSGRVKLHKRFDIQWVREYERLLAQGILVPPWRDENAVHPNEDGEIDT